MKVFVTGATGFIGKHLVRKLCDKKIEVTALIRKNSNISGIANLNNLSFVQGDIENKTILIPKKCNAVIHLAAQLGQYGVPKSRFFAVNVEATKNLIISASDAKIKQFIFISTPGVTGIGNRKVQETAPYNPRGIYEETKAIGEQETIRLCAEHKIPYTIIRPDFVYGEEDYRRISLYKRINNRSFLLPGKGTSFLHPTYVGDIINGIILTLNNPNAYNNIFNIAAEYDITSKEYLDTIALCFGKKIRTLPIPLKLLYAMAGIVELVSDQILHKDPFVTKSKIAFLNLDHSSDITKAKNILGYHPAYNFKEGIIRTVYWLKTEGLL